MQIDDLSIRNKPRYDMLRQEGLISENEYRLLCGMKPLDDFPDDFMIKPIFLPTEKKNKPNFYCKWWIPISLTVINLITLGISLIRILLF